MDPILQGTLIAFTYGIVLFILIKLFGVKYTEITASTQSIKKGIFFPVGIVGTGLIVVSALYGWLRPAFTPPNGYLAWWMWLIPAAILLGIIVRFTQGQWKQFSPMGIFYLVVGVAFVGISEELLTRGLLVQFLNQSGIPQYAVMLTSSIIFGLLHGMNYFNGQDRKTTTSQIIITTFIGMALYTSFIISGTLWLPIILHALFDISLLASGGVVAHTERKPLALEVFATLLMYAMTLITLITLFVDTLVV
ncbi:MAG: CPBP family intramembrane glutamic endopeptidase [Candidatus Saccharimonas sp.]